MAEVIQSRLKVCFIEQNQIIGKHLSNWKCTQSAIKANQAAKVGKYMYLITFFFKLNRDCHLDLI